MGESMIPTFAERDKAYQLDESSLQYKASCSLCLTGLLKLHSTTLAFVLFANRPSIVDKDVK